MFWTGDIGVQSFSSVLIGTGFRTAAAITTAVALAAVTVITNAAHAFTAA